MLIRGRSVPQQVRKLVERARDLGRGEGAPARVFETTIILFTLRQHRDLRARPRNLGLGQALCANIPETLRPLKLV